MLYFASICSAVTEDANLAIELKNGLSIGGRKIAAKHAMHRASLEQRRSKTNQGWYLIIGWTCMYVITCVSNKDREGKERRN